MKYFLFGFLLSVATISAMNNDTTARNLLIRFVRADEHFEQNLQNVTDLGRSNFIALIIQELEIIRDRIVLIQNVTCDEALHIIELITRRLVNSGRIYQNIGINREMSSLIMMAYKKNRLHLAQILAESPDLDLSFRNRHRESLEDLINQSTYENKDEWISLLSRIRSLSSRRHVMRPVNPIESLAVPHLNANSTAMLFYEYMFTHVANIQLRQQLQCSEQEVRQKNLLIERLLHNSQNDLSIHQCTISRLQQEVQEKNEIIAAMLETREVNISQPHPEETTSGHHTDEEIDELRGQINQLEHQVQENEELIAAFLENEETTIPQPNLAEENELNRSQRVEELLRQISELQASVNHYEHTLLPMFTCQICLESIENENDRALPTCGCTSLAFHRHCLEQYREYRRGILKCPQCRRTGQIRVFSQIIETNSLIPR